MGLIRFSITNLGGGGAEKILINILRWLPREKYRLELFLFEKKGIYLKDIPSDVELKYFINPEKFPKFLQVLYDKVLRRIAFRVLMYFPRLVYKISNVEFCDIDIAYIQDTTYLLRANFAKRRIAWLHCNIEDTPFYSKGLAHNLAVADQIVCVSADLKRNLNHLFPEFSLKTCFIHNPSALSEIRELSLSKEFSYSTPTIMAVGRLTQEKGFDVLIHAFKILHERHNDYSLKILGEGEDRGRLQELIWKLELDKSVELLGFLPNPYLYMRAADLFVLSSRYEGFGQVLVEALAVGTPVVATNCNTGPKEILLDGECGLLVPVDDPRQMARAIERLMEDVKLREYFIIRGLHRAADFDIPQILIQIEELFSTFSSEA